MPSPTIKFETASWNATIRKLKRLPKSIGPVALASAGNIFFKAVLDNISLGDHSLDELKNLGHPYARRHGAIQVHPINEHVVHTHTGRLIGALRSEVFDKGKGFRVELDATQVDYARFIVEGTRTLLPRDVIWNTAFEPPVIKAMSAQIVSDIWKQIRAVTR